LQRDLVDNRILSDVVRVAKSAAASDLLAATQGNFSARDPRTGLVAITPHDLPYDSLKTSDLVLLDVAGERLAGEREPSYDWRVHCTVYRERPRVRAMIHTEPPYVNAFGALGRDIEAVTTTGLKSGGGASVPIMPFRSVRDERFAHEMLELMGDRYAIVWGNHGLLVIAETIDQALHRTLGVEFNARVLHLSLALGQPRVLGLEDAKALAD
jgi:L-ribulose-5-phosphate 4-epimerase